MATIIDGKLTAATIKREIADRVAARVAEGKRRPHLAAILVGHDGGSETYVANKVKACEECGFTSTLVRFEDTCRLLPSAGTARPRCMHGPQAVL